MMTSCSLSSLAVECRLFAFRRFSSAQSPRQLRSRATFPFSYSEETFQSSSRGKYCTCSGSTIGMRSADTSSIGNNSKSGNSSNSINSSSGSNEADRCLRDPIFMSILSIFWRSQTRRKSAPSFFFSSSSVIRSVGSSFVSESVPPLYSPSSGSYLPIPFSPAPSAASRSLFFSHFFFSSASSSCPSSPSPSSGAASAAPSPPSSSFSDSGEEVLVSGDSCLVHPSGDHCPVRSRPSYSNSSLSCLVPRAGRSLSEFELYGGNVVWVHDGPIESPTFCRQCIATHQWSIFALNNSYIDKPDTYKLPASLEERLRTDQRSSHVNDCPFCVGNEDSCPPVLYEIKGSDRRQAWKIRVVRNMFPYLTQDDPFVICGFWGIHPQVTGSGIQEVIISHSRHNCCPALMTCEEVHLAIELLFIRGSLAAKDSRIRYVAMFENHGMKSGGSLEHPHLQVVGLPVIPSVVVQRLESAQLFYEEHGECVFCNIIQDELRDLEGDGSRIVYQNEDFIAFVPYAPSRAYQIWIVPKKHNHDVLKISASELDYLAKALWTCLRMVYYALDDPDYNFIIRTAPPQFRQTLRSHISGEEVDSNTFPLPQWDCRDSYHWYVEIIPHTTQWGGVSCLDMFVHKMLPEEMAKVLMQALDRREEEPQSEKKDRDQKMDGKGGVEGGRE